jgi:hypothetical protein
VVSLFLVFAGPFETRFLFGVAASIAKVSMYGSLGASRALAERRTLFGAEGAGWRAFLGVLLMVAMLRARFEFSDSVGVSIEISLSVSTQNWRIYGSVLGVQEML